MMPVALPVPDCLMAKPKPDVITCWECGQLNCYRHDRRYPTICATVDLSPEERAELVELYGGDSRDAVISRASGYPSCQADRALSVLLSPVCKVIL